MDTISNTLTERGTTHGDYEVNSAISQAIKDVIRSAPNWPRLKAYQKETLDMVAHKIGRTMAGDPNFLDHWVDAGGYVRLTVGLLERVKAPQPEPPQPAPELPRLNTGWKWAEINNHTIGKHDLWVTSKVTVETVEYGNIGKTLLTSIPLATPDWHNPENIADPGEGYRFLVKGERRGDSTHFRWNYDEWKETPLHENVDSIIGSGGFTATYRTPATRPLPPVLADEKEAQP